MYTGSYNSNRTCVGFSNIKVRTEDDINVISCNFLYLLGCDLNIPT